MASIQPLSGKLGKARARHLLSRATFKVSKARIEEFSDYTVSQALHQLTQKTIKNLSQPLNPDTGNPWIEDDPVLGNADEDFNGFKLTKGTTGWWLDEARRDSSVYSKMTYFLASYVCMDATFVNGNRGAYWDYLRLLERFCMTKSIETFMFEITINISMLTFLDNKENTKANPNENYAREVLELFTIGKGQGVGMGDYTNYTEEDVVQAAKLLTGWKSKWNNRDRASFGIDTGDIPTGYAKVDDHDFGKKVFSHRFGNREVAAYNTSGKTYNQKLQRMKEELLEFFDMIFDQEATSKYITRRLYRYFVSGNITDEVERDIIEPLASTFRSNDYELEPVVTQLLKSQHFYDEDDSTHGDEIIGGMIKSPLEMLLQTLNIFDYPVPDPRTQGAWHYTNFYQYQMIGGFLELASQDPFVPPSVAGFPPIYEAPLFDKFWFNSSTIVPRYQLGTLLLNKNKTKADFVVAKFVNETINEPEDPVKLVSELVELLFPTSISEERLNYFVDDILLDGSEPYQWTNAWNSYKSTGNTSGVEGNLQVLFKALVWSQEYQTN
ncbi:DUF1800 family protein [Wenyingzhuangia sp. IMCC45574]